MEPPREIDGAVVIQWAEVSADVLPTGRTRHVVEGEAEGPSVALAIARYADAEGYYLFYLNPSGDAVTDTHHDTVEGAVAQADYEYIGLTWRSTSE
jgi:hypothetical protein